MAAEHPSTRLVLQRIRNRVIEDLETFASYEEQARYQTTVPVSVPTEMFCMWADDHVTEGWRSWFTPPVFTPDEIDAVGQFDYVFRSVSTKLPDHLPQLREVVGTDMWERLRTTAAESLAVFRRRGRLSENDEIAE